MSDFTIIVCMKTIHKKACAEYFVPVSYYAEIRIVIDLFLFLHQISLVILVPIRIYRILCKRRLKLIYFIHSFISNIN